MCASIFAEIVPLSGKSYLLEIHPDELSTKELGTMLIIARLAFKKAVELKAREAVQRRLLDYHDEIFVNYCEAVPKFKQSLRKGYHEYLGGQERANQQKYWLLAGLNTQSSAS